MLNVIIFSDNGVMTHLMCWDLNIMPIYEQLNYDISY